MRIRTCLIVLTVLGVVAAGSLVPSLADGGAAHRVRNQRFGVSGGNVNDRTSRFCCSGTLGVLVQARQADVLPALKPVLDALAAEGFRIAPALIREALAHVGERA